MKDNTFEDYLHEKHSKQYVGTDDCMIDDFNDWRCALDPQEIIDYAEVYGEKRFNDGLGGHNYRMKDNQPNLSKCCNSPVQVESGEEGTCFWICPKCNNPCDVKTKQQLNQLKDE